MNTFALTTDTHRWWLPAAIAGAIAVVVLGAILILPTLGDTTTPVNNAPGVSVPTGADNPRTCFQQRPQRSHGDQLPQSACR